MAPHKIEYLFCAKETKNKNNQHYFRINRNTEEISAQAPPISRHAHHVADPLAARRRSQIALALSKQPDRFLGFTDTAAGLTSENPEICRVSRRTRRCVHGVIASRIG